MPTTGGLWVWGVPSREEVDGDQAATWAAGSGDPDPAAARFQVGDLRLDYYPSRRQSSRLMPPGCQFLVGRRALTWKQRRS